MGSNWDSWNSKKKDWEKKTGYDQDSGDKFMKGLMNVDNSGKQPEEKKKKLGFNKVKALFGK